MNDEKPVPGNPIQFSDEQKIYINELINNAVRRAGREARLEVVRLKAKLLEIEKLLGDV